ncbi:MAG: LuxR C-terminal-related transcriptional regulator, partial [Candidatus Dormibacteraeota bacterium]|nr:LuxR C-terminal-related transcriptional regulator [Candidatus Dormibacteraeota bacterium]
TLEWCRAHDAALWLRLATSLGWFWVTHGHLVEGRAELEGAVALTSLEPAARARGLHRLGQLVFWQDDNEATILACEQSIAISRELGDAAAAGWPQTLMASALMALDEHEEARSMLEQVRATATTSELRLEVTMLLGEQSLRLGNLGEARRLLEAGREMAGRPGRFRAAVAPLLLAIVDFFEGDLDRARADLGEALDSFAMLGHSYSIAAALNIAGGLAMAAGRPERALRLCAAADHLRTSIRARLGAHYRELTERLVEAPARDALGAAADEIWAAGERMTVEEALAFARSEDREVPAPSPGRRLRAPSLLSRREVEVAGLVARGLTNRQIAERLVLAERTIEGHVERIRGKLGVHSRTQIAVWVVGQPDGSAAMAPGA